MQRYNGQLLNQFPNTVTGISAAGAQITVRVKSTGALATLYAANSTSGATLSNPLTADSKGYYGFYAPDGVYTLDVSLSGTPQLEIQLQDVANLQSQFNDAVSNAGYIPVGTFAAGCTVSQANGVVSDGVSYWRWDGALPKTVTAGSSPVPTGVGGWILISGVAGVTEFESALADVGSTKVIAGFQARQLRKIDGLKSLIAAQGIVMDVAGFYSGTTIGGGQFYFDQAVSKSLHNGGTIIAPEAINAWSGSQSDIATLLSWTGTGSGCFVRQIDSDYGFFVEQFGAVGNGVADDTLSFKTAISAGYVDGSRVCLSASASGYKITSTIQLTQFVTIEGESSGLQDNYNGKKPAGSLIKYTGTGACFEVVASAPNPSTRRAYGVSFKRLVIQGTNSASYGIKIGDASNINNNDLSLSGINIEDVFIFDFFRGAAIGMFWVFGNNIKNFECQNCAVGLRTNYAHRTSIVGGTIEQCLMGVDAIHTYDLTFHGAGLQGISATRAPIFGMVMPADLFVWDGWNGTGPNAILRTVPDDYAGVGVRNLGSLLSWFGGYEESNQIGYVNEVGATTRLYGKYTDLDAVVKYFVQLGSGSFVCNDNVFAQGQYPALVSVFAQEKDFAVAPFAVTNPIYAATVPNAKKNTGFTTAAGVVDSFDTALFRGFRRSYNYDYEVIRGNVSAAGFKQNGGFNRLLQEQVLPTSTGTVTVDLGATTVGTTLIHVTSAANVTFNFASGGSRLAAGVEFIFHVINTGGSNSTLTFDTAQFRTGSASYTLGANKQRIFRFVFSNGFFIEQSVEVAL